MKRIGFSTGALARGDVRAGVEMQRSAAQGAIELSALREHELDAFIDAIPELDLRMFDHVSVHAPSRLVELSEDRLCSILSALPESWPIVAHPNVVTADAWLSLGSRLCIENMDGRKAEGRTAEELRPWMERFREARFCLDVAHAAGIDPSMNEAAGMIEAFGTRLAQLHVSRLGSSFEHLPIDAEMKNQIGRIRGMIPDDVPIVIESVVEDGAIATEIEYVAEAFGR